MALSSENIQQSAYTSSIGSNYLYRRCMGYTLDNPNNVLVNHIVLLFKKFSYQNKSNPQRIHILALKHYIKLAERIEQKIAYDAHKLDIHFIKWEPVQIIF